MELELSKKIPFFPRRRARMPMRSAWPWTIATPEPPKS